MRSETSRYIAMATLTLVLVACGSDKDSTSPSQQAVQTYDGSWTGTTSQGQLVAFTVAGATIRDVSIKFQLTGNCGIAGTTVNVVGPAGTLSSQQFTLGSAAAGFTVSGTFSSFTAVAGTASYTQTGSNPPCTSTATATWSAHKP